MDVLDGGTFMAFKMRPCTNRPPQASIYLYEDDTDWKKKGYSFTVIPGLTPVETDLLLTYWSNHYKQERTFHIYRNRSCPSDHYVNMWISWGYGGVEVGFGSFRDEEKRVGVFYPPEEDLVDVKYIAVDGGTWNMPIGEFG